MVYEFMSGYRLLLTVTGEILKQLACKSREGILDSRYFIATILFSILLWLALNIVVFCLGVLA